MDLLPLIHPKSIAIIGASRDSDKIGAQILSNLVKSNYKGALIPVNPHGGLIQGIQSFKSIKDYPEAVDLVIIAIPQPIVESIVDECIIKKVKAVVIITAGFKEVSEEGKVLEQQIKEKLSKANIPLLGPNCLGIISTYDNMNASFAAQMPDQGNIMFMSQSGAFGTAAIDWASNHHLGFTEFISLGNKSMLNENDFLKRLSPQTKVIVLYLEEISDGKELMSQSMSITPKIPILLLKPGKSEKAALAVKSHTGSLTGSDKVLNTATTQSGIIRVNTTQDLFDLTKAFSSLPSLMGNRIAVITNAGGPGIITTDALETSGLELAPISAKTQEELSRHLPRQANIHDPIDLIGDAKAERYDFALNAVMNEETVDACIVILTPQSSTEIALTAQSIMSHVQRTKKPILAAFMGGTLIEEATKTLTKNNIPCYTFPEQAVYVLSKMWEYQSKKAAIQNLPPLQQITHIPEIISQNILKKAKSENRLSLSQNEIEDIFKGTGITFPARIEVNSSQDAFTKASQLGFPVVMKISSEKVIHKTDQHGVYLNLLDEKQIKESFTQLTALQKKVQDKSATIYVQKQISLDTEILLGMKRDPTFGPVIVVGTGGIYTELYQDTSSRIAPITRNQAHTMLTETRLYQMLSGYRGKDSINIEPIIQSILNIANISLTYPEIQEIDINPLAVKGSGIIALDARVIL